MGAIVTLLVILGVGVIVLIALHETTGFPF